MNTETARFRKRNWLQPKLGNLITMFDVNVRRLQSFEAVEEETEATNAQHRWHAPILSAFTDGIHGTLA